MDINEKCAHGVYNPDNFDVNPNCTICKPIKGSEVHNDILEITNYPSDMPGGRPQIALYTPTRWDWNA